MDAYSGGFNLVNALHFEQIMKTLISVFLTSANVSDLGGNKGDVITSYGVVALPDSYLIGKDGRIMEHFVGYEDNTYQLMLNAIASMDLVSSNKVK